MWKVEMQSGLYEEKKVVTFFTLFFWSVGGIGGDLFSMVMVCVQWGKI